MFQLVVTEHPSLLTAASRRRYEEARSCLGRIAARRVESVHYLDVSDFRGVGGLVLSGSRAPWAAHDREALLRLGEAIRGFAGPVLGICAGMQLQAMSAGGSVGRARVECEQGFGPIEVLDHEGLLRSLPARALVYKHHDDEVHALPEGFDVLARSRECAVEAFAARDRPWWGAQFHPEEFDAAHPAGEVVLRNFFALALAHDPARTVAEP